MLPLCRQEHGLFVRSWTLQVGIVTSGECTIEIPQYVCSAFLKNYLMSPTLETLWCSVADPFATSCGAWRVVPTRAWRINTLVESGCNLQVGIPVDYSSSRRTTDSAACNVFSCFFCCFFVDMIPRRPSLSAKKVLMWNDMRRSGEPRSAFDGAARFIVCVLALSYVQEWL